MLNGITTRSPGRMWVTSAPTSSTMPIGSWPRTSPLSRYMPSTSYRCRSEPQIAVEVIRTIASVGSWIFGSGTVSTDTFAVPCQVRALISSCLPTEKPNIPWFDQRDPGQRGSSLRFMTTRPPLRLFDRGSWAEVSRIADILRTETIGGVLLLAAAVIALVWANSPWDESYQALAGLTVGGLSLSAWAADGLLAIFFFVAGLELKREFVAGDLRDPRRAALPVAAAVGGMAVPALIFVAVNAAGSGTLRGWAVPTATDIAFALAVLAVISTHLPSAMRTFLLTLAVVDDLLAITIIAVFYTSDLHLLPLAAALVPLAAFAVLVQRRVRSWWLLLPLAAVTWLLVHESGVHATVAGVLLAFAVPVRRRAARRRARAWPSTSSTAGARCPPGSRCRSSRSSPPASGRPAQDWVVPSCWASWPPCWWASPWASPAATWLVQRFTRARLAEGLSWWDVLGLALLGGVGFTVSLLIGELAYGPGTERDAQAKIGVLLGSVITALLAAVLLRLRNRHYRRLWRGGVGGCGRRRCARRLPGRHPAALIVRA